MSDIEREVIHAILVKAMDQIDIEELATKAAPKIKSRIKTAINNYIEETDWAYVVAGAMEDYSEIDKVVQKAMLAAVKHAMAREES